MPKEHKVFVDCEMCGASVRDCNLLLHRAKAHGIAELHGSEEKIDIKNPSEENKRKLSELYVSQGHSLLHNGKHKEAGAFLRKAIECDKENIEAYLLLVKSLESRGNSCNEIDSLLDAALQIEPGNPKIICRKAEHLNEHGEHMEAARLLRTAKNAEENGEVMELLAQALMYSGKLDEAKGELVAAWLKLRAQFEAGRMGRIQFLQLGIILFTLVMTDKCDIHEEDESSTFIKLSQNFCSHCRDEIMEITKAEGKGKHMLLEAKCGKCGDVVEMSDEGGTFSMDFLRYVSPGKSKKPKILSLDTMKLSPERALVEIKFETYGKSYFTGFDYAKTPPEETLELIRKELYAVSALTDDIPEGKTAAFVGKRAAAEAPDGFIFRNDEDEKSAMSGFFTELKAAQENWNGYSGKEKLLARINRRDFEDEGLDMEGADIVQRIGVCRSMALLSEENGMHGRAGDYLRDAREILAYLNSWETGYGGKRVEEMIMELGMFEGDDGELPPEGLLLEIMRRKDCSRLLLEMVKDSDNWGVDIWHAATNAMYLIGAIGDKEVIPDFLSVVSALDEKDFLGDMVTEELGAVLASFGPESADALSIALKNTNYGEFVRNSAGDALAVIAFLEPKTRLLAIETFRKIVSSDASEILVAYAIEHLCALNDEGAKPVFEKAFAENRVDEFIIKKDDADYGLNSRTILHGYLRHCRHPLELVGIPDFLEDE